MSESDFNREPVQIVEILVPKCTNVHGSSPCTATETGSGKCFNTRSTCNDPDNYQARPLAHLTPDVQGEQGDTSSHSVSGSTYYLLEIDLRIGLEPEGVLFEIGSNPTNFYVGFDTSNQLVARCGDGSGTTSNDTARVVIDPTQWLGKTKTIIVEIENTGSVFTINVYMFCPLLFTLSLIGSATSVSNTGGLFGVGNYGVGTVAGATADETGTADYNSVITAARLYEAPASGLLDTSEDAYRERYFFDDGRLAKPSDDIYILPLLRNAGSVGSRINISGADEKYEPIGRRAFLSLDMQDAPHTDFPYDPYLDGRGYDPLTRSTFWMKWLKRQKFGKTRALVRVYNGYRGDSLDDMRSQSYVLDKLTWGREAVRIECRDFLSMTEFTKAQVPAPSDGKLALTLEADATTAYLLGNETDDYPTSGTIRIGSELMTYTGTSYDSVEDWTEFTGLTRGTDGSEAAEHSFDEEVQLCRRYTNATIAEVLEELLAGDAAIPAQVINLSKIASETAIYHSFFRLTTVISEPTGVDQLLGELAMQCGFYIWWNERDQLIDFQAIRASEQVSVVLSEDDHIIADSFMLKEQPKERITTISIFFNPRDFAGDLEKPANYKNLLLISNSTASGPDQYGRLPQTREVFSRWIQTEAQLNQSGSRMSVRFADVPQYAEFKVDAKDRQYWLGDYVRIEHGSIVDNTGAKDNTRRWIIIEAEEVEPGHAQKLVCIDATLDGFLYFINSDSVTDDYPTDPTPFDDSNYAFITDDDGFYEHPTTGLRTVKGATIS